MKVFLTSNKPLADLEIAKEGKTPRGFLQTHCLRILPSQMVLAAIPDKYSPTAAEDA